MTCKDEDWNSFFYNILANGDDKKYAFFVGAGISVGSGLPPFNKFMDNFIEELVPYEWKTKIDNAIIKRLRPEVLLQIIYQVYGDKTLEFYKCLDGGTPNENHYFLALCLAKGHCIITPNVDNLIEQACSNLKIPYKSVYMSSKEDISNKYPIDVSKITTYKDIKENYSFNISSKIFKFHGSIESTKDNLEKYRSIRFILNRVGLGLDQYTTEVLEKIIQERDLIFIGYSGNDHFSAYPLLLKVNSDHNLYWFKYNSENTLTQNMENFKKLRAKKINNLLENPFFENWEYISLLDIIIKRSPNSYLIEGNSSKNIENVILHLKKVRQDSIKSLIDSIPYVSAKTPEIKLNWSDKVTNFQKHYCIALLLYRAGDINKAEEEIENALLNAKDPADYANAKYLKARMYSFSRDITKYTTIVSEINELTKNIPSEKQQISNLHISIELANIHRGNREFATALEILDQVEEDIKKYKDNGIFENADSPYEYPILMSHMLTIRALVYGMGLTGKINNKIKALEYCDEALDFAVQAGDITRKASILNSKGLIICQLAERNLNLLQEAGKLLNDSLLLSSQIQDTERCMQVCRNLMLTNYLYSLSTKSKVHEYWLDEALKTIDMADKYLKEIKPTASTIVGHEIEIDSRKSQIMAARGLNKEASAHYKNLLNKQKDPHQKARILHNLMNLSKNDEEKKYFSVELVSILEKILGSDDECKKYQYDVIKLENISDMLVDLYFIAITNDEDLFSRINSLLKKGLEVANSLGDKNLIICFNCYLEK